MLMWGHSAYIHLDSAGVLKFALLHPESPGLMTWVRCHGLRRLFLGLFIAIAILGGGSHFSFVLSATFVIEDDAFEGHTGGRPVAIKVLRNTATGEWASVITSHGGTVDQVVLRVSRAEHRKGSAAAAAAAVTTGAGTGDRGGDAPVLVALLEDHGRSAAAVEENKFWKGRVLLPFANRIANGTYAFGGAVHHLERNECFHPDVRCGALHGLLHKCVCPSHLRVYVCVRARVVSCFFIGKNDTPLLYALSLQGIHCTSCGP